MDKAIADDLLTILHFLREQRCYVEDLGFEEENGGLATGARRTPCPES